MDSNKILREFMKQAQDPLSTPIGKGWMGPQIKGQIKAHGVDEFRPVGDKYRLWGNHFLGRAKAFGADVADAVNPVRIYNESKQNVANNAAWREKEYGRGMANTQNVVGPIAGLAMLGGLGYGGYKAFPYAKKGIGLLRKFLSRGKA